MASGHLKCEIAGNSAKFVSSEATYPFKFLTPKRIPRFPNSLTAFMVTYGGGLVSGDVINVKIEVGRNVELCVMTQASTKVYKKREGSQRAQQNLLAEIHPDAVLVMTPEPVTCFRKSNYTQTQEFRLCSSGSLVLLDWLTCGRLSRGECWQFERYVSINTIYVDGRQIIRDAWVLGDSVKERVDPYKCFATLIMVGPKVMGFVNDAVEEFKKVKVDGKRKNADDDDGFIWSVSPVVAEDTDEICGAVVRAAAVETGIMRNFLSKRLERVRDMFGEHLFERQI